MSLLKKRFLDRDAQSPDHIGAASLPYDPTRTIKDVIDPLIAPSLETEYIALTSVHITEKRCRLDNTVARRSSVVVDVIGGTPQLYNRDFIVSEDSPNYIYWAGMTMETLLAVGDTLRVTYETEGIPLGVAAIGEEPEQGLPTVERITTDFTVTESATLMVDATADVVQVNLPYVVDSKDMTVIIKHVAGANGILVAPTGTDTIDGHDELILDVSNAAYTLVCDGTGWYIV